MAIKKKETRGRKPLPVDNVKKAIYIMVPKKHIVKAQSEINKVAAKYCAL